ncbi:NADH:flavin oxidoreductase [Candidatus Thiodictyon syntrophicum]|jgi:2,4-dienoyl-CoA reductase-like NADH-dependent reductase (Old Yellow Enzyme family)|uniref:NADH:flavin oxidoreductase n=1 Tax=Candidatus Thiodictyon syntrophicum TaxID=1166950 RepID=A0A2K8U465_9GAMM|nr:NADH:flavin oxidoreductase [Candidatus Thiodictyon syntrophicum]AUB80384.1 NADH:flavin oxidoreductase [Candidatus Thiodictyon syntrophicum]
MSALFEPFTLKGVTLRNRIAVPPMCQYMAVDGLINEWHRVHLAGLARGGAGLVITEATAVSPKGRITPGCAGIWNDTLAQAFAPVVASIKAAGAVPGIQIAHAGRKASANRPWEGDDHLAAGDPRGWPTIAPSAIAFGVIEYDGRDEETLAEAIELARGFKAEGLDLLSVSVGFSTPTANIPWAPAFLAPIAQRVRREAGLPVASAWGIDTPELAEGVVRDGQLDLVMVGRAHLADPHWPYYAARTLGIDRPAWVLPAPYAHWLERYRD